MNKKIILLTGYEHFFGQTRKPWVSINTNAFIAELEKHGVEIAEHSFHEVLNTDFDLRDSIILYTFSQRANLRHYMKDVVHTLLQKGNITIPNYELLLSHENKGYQESRKKSLGIDNLPAFYLSSKREIINYKLEFPIVLKTIEGSNGKGVFLIHSQEHLLQAIRKLEDRLSIFTKLDLFRRKYLRLPKKYSGYDLFESLKDYEQYKDYIIPEIPFILQKFIPGLQYDYRVIILGDHFYVTKRLTRKGDFRASGAKRFTFDFNAPADLLDYAKSIYDKFDNPTLSIDIGFKDREFFLFEYQALHFGINAIVRGNGYYQNSSKGWEFFQHKPSFEKELCYAYITYLNKKKLI